MNQQKKKIVKITNENLFANQYSMEELAENIWGLRLRSILHTQKLDATFCAEYILNEYYQVHDSECYIVDATVYHTQPHITKEELEAACFKFEQEQEEQEEQEEQQQEQQQEQEEQEQEQEQ